MTEPARKSAGGTITFDTLIVGGGIVGLATALTLKQRSPERRVGVVEAESAVSQHQSGHNSGVLHSGLYYRPGSEKALCCREGKALMEAFCEQHQIPWDRCGKVVVATTADEIARLDAIAQRAKANGVEHRQINTDELRELEPAVAGLAALHVPESGIVNYRRVCEVMAGKLTEIGGVARLNCRVTTINQRSGSLHLSSEAGDSLECGQLVNCGGLYSDRLYRMAGGETDVRIVPFRGEYFELTQASESLCRNLIYPVPDPAFPFLGVHFTRMIDGGVECGPNAVLALAREGYSWGNVNPKDLLETACFSGFRKLAVKHWRMGLGEIHRSLSKTAFVGALQKLIPSIQSSDLKPGRAGVRAQAIQPDGQLVDDFLIRRTPHAVHVLNAPSPAATASLAIASRIVDQLSSSDG
ncbi:MAG: L-2-hydroxyglutarate oxidase [Planctomycetota bacterium]